MIFLPLIVALPRIDILCFGFKVCFVLFRLPTIELNVLPEVDSFAGVLLRFGVLLHASAIPANSTGSTESPLFLLMVELRRERELLEPTSLS